MGNVIAARRLRTRVFYVIAAVVAVLAVGAWAVGMTRGGESAEVVADRGPALPDAPSSESSSRSLDDLPAELRAADDPGSSASPDSDLDTSELGTTSDLDTGSVPPPDVAAPADATGDAPPQSARGNDAPGNDGPDNPAPGKDAPPRRRGRRLRR